MEITDCTLRQNIFYSYFIHSIRCRFVSRLVDLPNNHVFIVLNRVQTRRSPMLICGQADFGEENMDVFRLPEHTSPLLCNTFCGSPPQI